MGKSLEIKTFFKYFVFLSLVILSAVALFAQKSETSLSFNYGYILFSLNMMALMVAFKIVFEEYSSRFNAENRQLPSLTPKTIILVMGAGLKLAFLGMAIYLGLAVLGLSPFYLVGGAVSSLGLTTVLAVFFYSFRKLRPINFN